MGFAEAHQAVIKIKIEISKQFIHFIILDTQPAFLIKRIQFTIMKDVIPKYSK
ncbi:hypothetical protein SDC9_111906 [bioreactor metagenome]|uniref:Uncharacterized protein n=1 Tax=bioreactor metagenome TaxID=1076179 RepID=A0A645BT86_9ZZZZ